MRFGIGLLLVLAVIIIGAGTTYGKWGSGLNLSFDMIEIEQKESAASEGIVDIEVHTTTVDVKVVKSVGDQITARLYGRVNENRKDSYKLEKTVKDGVLQLYVEEAGSTWSLGLGDSLDLEIRVPKGQYEKLTAELGTGDIQIDGLDAKRIDVETKTGDVELSSVKAEQFRVETTTGDLNLSQVEGAIEASATSGDVEIGMRELSRDVKVETKTGDVNVRLDRAPAAVNVDLKAGTGDVTCDLNGLHYDEKSEKRALGGAGTGGPNLNVRTSTGDIQVRG